MADFPSTWDELTVELQCAAHDLAGNGPKCAGHDHVATGAGAALFSPPHNKYLFHEALRRYCGIF